MKTTVELSDVLLEQAKQVAAQQGTTLKALMESGLRWAIAPKPAVAREWSNLSFTPALERAGHQVAPSQWRDWANGEPDLDRNALHSRP